MTPFVFGIVFVLGLPLLGFLFGLITGSSDYAEKWLFWIVAYYLLLFIAFAAVLLLSQNAGSGSAVGDVMRSMTGIVGCITITVGPILALILVIEGVGDLIAGDRCPRCKRSALKENFCESCQSTYCKTCRYDLTGNATGGCPECGTIVPSRPTAS